MKLIPSEDLYLPVWCRSHSRFKPAVVQEVLWDPKACGLTGLIAPSTPAARGWGEFSRVKLVFLTPSEGSRQYLASLRVELQPGEVCSTLRPWLLWGFNSPWPVVSSAWPLVVCLLWYSAAGSTVLRAERSGRKRGVDSVLDGLLGLSGAHHGNEAVSGK